MRSWEPATARLWLLPAISGIEERYYSNQISYQVSYLAVGRFLLPLASLVFFSLLNLASIKEKKKSYILHATPDLFSLNNLAGSPFQFRIRHLECIMFPNRDLAFFFLIISSLCLSINYRMHAHIYYRFR